MKIGRYFVIILMVIGMSLIGIQVFGHPPQNMELDYDAETKILDVTITHSVSNPNDHYIYKVEIKKNDELIQTENYDNQPSSTTFTYSYSVDAVGGNVLKVTAFCSIFGDISREIIVPSNGDNNPPNKPELDGQTSGKAGTEYEYTFKSVDPDGDNIFYCIDWGDNSEEICIGPFPSGEEKSTSYSWNSEGTYTVRVKARDINNAESDWTTLTVTIPKNKLINSLLFRFLENHPIIFTILKWIQEL
jgi:hypothetical protein